MLPTWKKPVKFSDITCQWATTAIRMHIKYTPGCIVSILHITSLPTHHILCTCAPVMLFNITVEIGYSFSTFFLPPLLSHTLIFIHALPLTPLLLFTSCPSVASSCPAGSHPAGSLGGRAEYCLTSTAVEYFCLSAWAMDRMSGSAFQQVLIEHDPDTPWHLQAVDSAFSTI